MNFDNYTVNVNQTGPVHFAVEIITPDKLSFKNNFQANPAALNKENLINHLIGKETHQEWILDLKPKDAQVLKEETKIEKIS